MFRSFQNCQDNLQDLEKIEAWTRQRFALEDQDIVLVSENMSRIPGCPPLETEISFWTDAETKYRFKIFKPVCDVRVNDLPISWLKNALLDDGENDCC